MNYSRPIYIPKDKDQYANTLQNDRLWISIPDNYIETGQTQDFTDDELVKDEYTRV